MHLSTVNELMMTLCQLAHLLGHLGVPKLVPLHPIVSLGLQQLGSLRSATGGLSQLLVTLQCSRVGSRTLRLVLSNQSLLTIPCLSTRLHGGGVSRLPGLPDSFSCLNGHLLSLDLGLCSLASGSLKGLRRLGLPSVAAGRSLGTIKLLGRQLSAKAFHRLGSVGLDDFSQSLLHFL